MKCDFTQEEKGLTNPDPIDYHSPATYFLWKETGWFIFLCYHSIRENPHDDCIRTWNVKRKTWNFLTSRFTLRLRSGQAYHASRLPQGGAVHKRTNLLNHLVIAHHPKGNCYETYISTASSQTKKQIWFSETDVWSEWSKGSLSTACQRTESSLGLTTPGKLQICKWANLQMDWWGVHMFANVF